MVVLATGLPEQLSGPTAVLQAVVVVAAVLVVNTLGAVAAGADTRLALNADPAGGSVLGRWLALAVYAELVVRTPPVLGALGAEAALAAGRSAVAAVVTRLAGVQQRPAHAARAALLTGALGAAPAGHRADLTAVAVMAAIAGRTRPVDVTRRAPHRRGADDVADTALRTQTWRTSI